MKKPVLVILVLVLVLLALTACGSDKKQEVTDEATKEPVATEAAATEEPQPTEAPAVEEPTAIPEEDTLSLDSRATGLDQLKSYRLHWQSQWTATDSGETSKGNWDWSEEYSADPQGLHWIWQFTDASGQKTSKMEAWQIADTTYMMSYDDQGNGSCTSFSSSDPNSGLTKGMFNPSMLGNLNGAKYAGTEDVNNIRAKHYKYDEKSANLAGFGQVSGETWMAVDGGFVVKDVVKWKGGAGPLGLGASGNGEGSWNWELTDANVPIEIRQPENCSNASSDLPILGDATDKASIGDMVTYKSKTSLDDAIAFYQQKMRDTGWAPEGEPTTMEGFSILNFAKGDQKAGVTIASEEGGITVIINVTKGE